MFTPIFEHWLGEELGRKPRVFLDLVGIPTGRDWVKGLARELSRSRVLLTLATRPYFEDSAHCLAEFEHSRWRAGQSGCGTVDCPDGLVAIASLADGDDFPEPARRLQRVVLNDVSSPFITRDSTRREALGNAVQALAKDVARLVRDAPAPQPEWLADAEERLERALLAPPRAPTSVLPSLGGA